jgi:alpha-amylase
MINTVKSSCSDTSLVGSFSENHDQPRFASLTGDMSQARNVLSYTMLADGIPIVYEGQEQHYNAEGGSNDPYNREAIWFSDYNTEAELYELVATLNKARKQAISDDSSYLTYQNYPIYTDTTTLAMRKGKMVTVLSNKGADGASYTQSIASGYAGGTGLTEVLSCDTLSADSDGNVDVPMANGQPRVYYPTSSLSGSGLCGAGSKRSVMDTQDKVARHFVA